MPDGSDAYLFMLTGTGRIAANGTETDIARESFAVVGETRTFSLANPSVVPAEIVYVLAPPINDRHALRCAMTRPAPASSSFTFPAPSPR